MRGTCFAVAPWTICAWTPDAPKAVTRQRYGAKQAPVRHDWHQPGRDRPNRGEGRKEKSAAARADILRCCLRHNSHNRFNCAATETSCTSTIIFMSNTAQGCSRQSSRSNQISGQQSAWPCLMEPQGMPGKGRGGHDWARVTSETTKQL